MFDMMTVAKIAHEANRDWCRVNGDESQLAWDEAPDWQRESALAGVLFLRDNRAAGPEDTHKSWLRVKEKEGWTYGEIKDPEAKTHPCFLPYAELPAEHRAKDTLFCGVVRACLATNRMSAGLAP